VLVMGGAFVISKSNQQVLVARAAAKTDVSDAVPAAGKVPVAPRDRNAALLDAMKEELFQLEIDRQQGKVNAEEYATAKAALDETIKRALARTSS